MQRSVDRIFTTHVGSLARPPALLGLMRASADGREVDPARLCGGGTPRSRTPWPASARPGGEVSSRDRQLPWPRGAPGHRPALVSRTPGPATVPARSGICRFICRSFAANGQDRRVYWRCASRRARPRREARQRAPRRPGPAGRPGRPAWPGRNSGPGRSAERPGQNALPRSGRILTRYFIFRWSRLIPPGRLVIIMTTIAATTISGIRIILILLTIESPLITI
jgi:hypothetical protein